MPSRASFELRTTCAQLVRGCFANLNDLSELRLVGEDSQVRSQSIVSSPCRGTPFEGVKNAVITVLSPP